MAKNQEFQIIPDWMGGLRMIIVFDIKDASRKGKIYQQVNLSFIFVHNKLCSIEI